MYFKSSFKKYTRRQKDVTDAYISMDYFCLLLLLLLPLSIVCRVVSTDGTLSVNTNSDLYGDTVKLRHANAVDGDKYTIMIDTMHALSAGLLRYFYVFIEQKDPYAPASNLRLQIWRQNDLIHAKDQYQLVWQRLVYLNDSSPQALYAVKRISSFSDLFRVLNCFQLCWHFSNLTVESTCWYCPHSMRSKVCETVRCPSVCPSASVCLSQHGPTPANPLLQGCCCRPDRQLRVNADSATSLAYVGS